MKLIHCFILIALLSLNGCGFHLRTPHPNAIHELELQFTESCPKFENQLRSYLKSSRIDVYDYEAKNDTKIQNEGMALLQIGCPKSSQQPLVYDGEGQLRRERLRLKLTATLNHHKEIVLETTRERQLNSNQSLGDSAEKNMIIREMQETLFYQLQSQIS